MHIHHNSEKKTTSPVITSYLSGARERWGAIHASLIQFYLLAHKLRIDMKIKSSIINSYVIDGQQESCFTELVYPTLINALFKIVKKRESEHLFIKCDITLTFWENVQNGGLMPQQSLKILLRKILPVLGIRISELSVEENLWPLYAKYFIYGCKYRKKTWFFF